MYNCFCHRKNQWANDTRNLSHFLAHSLLLMGSFFIDGNPDQPFILCILFLSVHTAHMQSVKAHRGCVCTIIVPRQRNSRANPVSGTSYFVVKATPWHSFNFWLWLLMHYYNLIIFPFVNAYSTKNEEDSDGFPSTISLWNRSTVSLKLILR